MTKNVLVADDSLTIQKVVKITLTEQGYSIAECLSEEELYNKLKQKNFDLVLLDFNLSEEKSGLILAKDIFKIRPQTRVILLMGAFDKIEEMALKECGISGKIIKPFDSRNLIEICQSALSSPVDANDGGLFSEAALKSRPPQTQSVLASQPVAEDDLWVVNAGSAAPTAVRTPPGTNAKLGHELNGWGVDLPPTQSEDLWGIGQEEMLPPPVADVLSLKPTAEKLPSEDDLAYPEINFSEKKTKSISVGNSAKESLGGGAMGARSQLISLDQLNHDVRDEERGGLVLEDESTSNFSFDKRDLLGAEEKLRNLELQIEDELDQDFWNEESDSLEEQSEIPKFAVDSIGSVGASLPALDSSKVHKKHVVRDEDSEGTLEFLLDEPAASASLSEFDAPLMSSATPTIAPLNEDRIIEKVASLIRADLVNIVTPIVEAQVKQYCTQSVDKVAWDVIPDLAENFIKREIAKIVAELEQKK